MPIPVHFSSLIHKNVDVHSCHLPFDLFQCALIHESNIPDSYVILLFKFTSITSHIHNWALFLLWLCLFIVFGVISLLFSIAYWAPTDLENSSFSFVIFLPFHTVHEILKARILKCFAIPFSSGPHFVRCLHHDPYVLGGPTQHGS